MRCMKTKTTHGDKDPNPRTKYNLAPGTARVGYKYGKYIWGVTKSLPENSIGSWEELEDAFRANFQGTYVRPPYANDLSHIIQQSGESARKLWNRFLTKKNQIVGCTDAESLAAFKHNVRDEWLARHLGQEKPRTMAALTSLTDTLLRRGRQLAG